MSRKIKKSVSILLALVMLCGVLAVAPVAVNAAKQQYTLDGATYTYNTDTRNLNLDSGTFNTNSWGSNITKANVLTVTAKAGVVFTGDCNRMFQEFTNCTSIDLSNVNTSDVTNFYRAFDDCSSLTTINLSGFDTKNVTNTVYMFNACKNLKEITISDKFKGGITSGMNLNNGKTSDPGWITKDSTTGEIVSGITNNVPAVIAAPGKTTTYIWFASSKEYTFDPNTGELHLKSGFFRGRSFQNNDNGSLNWYADFSRYDVRSITADSGVKFSDSCERMFQGFSNCTNIDLRNVDTSHVTNMYRMFAECTNLADINVSKFDTSKVTNMEYMFHVCGSLTSLDLSSFDTSKVTKASEMFGSCDNLRELTISDKFTGGIKSIMALNNGEKDNGVGNGWRIKGEPTAANVSGDGNIAVISAPADKTTYKWIGYFDVDWKNWDGTKLVKTEEYKAETNIHPTYKGTTPTKPDSDGKRYTFAGWVDDLGNIYDKNADLPAVTRDTTYTAHYNQAKTEYTLNYIYQGRKGGNNGGYVGDDGDTDEKTYTVTVELGDSDLEVSGMPKAKVLVDNAPVVNDPYKTCRWTFTDEYVEFDSGNKVVTITANQPERLYRVELKNSDNSLIYTTRVKLNSFVQKDDSFITVPETDGSGTKFAYWSVVQNGKETARCFEKRFNLRVTGDSVVTAHYGEAENLVTLSDAEISRQKFTENGATKDLLYADFITAYMNKQGMELSTKGSSEYKTGVIVQYSPNVKVEKENAPGETLSENDKKTFAAGDLLTAADAKTIANGGTVGGKYSYLNAPIDNTKYNDKNRLNKSLVFTNTETARRLVLCAYYYVYNVKTDEIEMTAPVYFYLYDAGNAIVEES